MASLVLNLKIFNRIVNNIITRPAVSV